MGLAYRDTQLIATGSTLAALEIHAAQMWWHVGKEHKFYQEDFTKNNKLVSVLWSNKRGSGLWFAPVQWRECRIGIYVLPLSSITEALLTDVGYVKELVEWTLPNLNRKGVEEG